MLSIVALCSLELSIFRPESLPTDHGVDLLQLRELRQYSLCVLSSLLREHDDVSRRFLNFVRISFLKGFCTASLFCLSLKEALLVYQLRWVSPHLSGCGLGFQVVWITAPSDAFIGPRPSKLKNRV